jgi:hypothetical protein
MIRWLSLLLPVAVLLGASSPAIAQRSPRFLFPGLAVAGGALLVLSAGRAARDLRRGTRRPSVGLAAIAVATLLFVVLPLARLASLAAPTAGGTPRILTGFGDRRGAEEQRGTDSRDLHDPLPRMAGCFAGARYPTDRLVLTYPVRC